MRVTLDIVYSLTTMVPKYQTTLCHSPDDPNMDNRRRQNVKSRRR